MKRAARSLAIKLSRGQPPLSVCRPKTRELVIICAACHHLWDGVDQWLSLEEFLEKKLKVQLSHHLCTRCSEKLRNEPWLTDKLSDL